MLAKVDSAVPRQLDLTRATMVASGFDGKVAQTRVLPRPDGPTVVCGEVPRGQLHRVSQSMADLAHRGMACDG